MRSHTFTNPTATAKKPRISATKITSVMGALSIPPTGADKNLSPFLAAMGLFLTLR